MDRSGIEEAAAAAVQTAFEELCQTPVVPAEAVAPAGAVVATIGLKRTPPGVLCLAFAPAALEALARRYLPEEPPSEDLWRDAAGEFANVIAGQLKTCLKGTPFHFDLSTPQVTDRLPPLADPIALGFACDAGSFLLSISLP
ncbi:MAG: chemotaxis protein CheX [Gemmataceae bacterium]